MTNKINLRPMIEVLKDAEIAIERLGGLNCDENGNSDYEWLDSEIELHIKNQKGTSYELTTEKQLAKALSTAIDWLGCEKDCTKEHGKEKGNYCRKCLVLSQAREALNAAERAGIL